MNFQEQYNQKLISLDSLLEKVKSNDIIVPALAGCEPSGFLERLHEIDNRVENVRVFNALEFSSFPFQDPEREIKNIRSMCYFFGGSSRRLHSTKRTSLLPSHFRNFSKWVLEDKKPNIFVASVTPMDRFGYFTMSLSMCYERPFLEAADMVVLEVNDKMPRVLGDTIVHISQVDYVYENNHDIVTASFQEPGEKEKKIGSYIADFVQDGSVFQLGIGGIPNAVANCLKNKKHLGIHSEMLTEGMMELIKIGTVTNLKKKIYKGKTVAAFAFGSQKLYDFLHDNPSIAILDGDYVNNPYVIAQNDNMISINTTMQVDLTGQCCSESIGNKQYSGIGGQTDTVLGALMSKGGRSIIALPSTTKDEKISKITPFLTLGAAVTLSRNDVDYIVTEYGAAKMRGQTVAERAENLIAIAHPKFRKELKEQAEMLQIW